AVAPAVRGNDSVERETAVHGDRRGALADAARVPGGSGSERAVQVVAPAIGVARLVDAAAMIAAEADGGEGRARRHEGRSREDAGPVARPAVARAPAPHSPVHRYAAGLAVARRARGERGESHARDLD